MGHIITFKPSCRFKEFSLALDYILHTLVHTDFGDLAPGELVITSVNDSTHMAGSKHYSNEALDVRSHTFLEANKIPFANRLSLALNKLYPGKFTVLFEDKGTANEHFHIQVAKGKTFP